MEEARRRLAESIRQVAVSGKEILWSPAAVAAVRTLEARQAGQDAEVRILLGNYWLIRWRATRQRSALRKAAAVLGDFDILTQVITSAGAADAVDAAAAQAQADVKAEVDKIEREKEDADPVVAVALSTFVLSHMRLAGADYVTAAQRNLAYSYWLSGRHRGSLDDMAAALALSLEALSAEPDDTPLSMQLIADIAAGVTVFAEAIPTQFLPDLQEQFAPRARRYAAGGYRPESLYAGLGAIALTVWHAYEDENALAEAREVLEQAAAATGPGTEGYVGAKANLGATALLQVRSSGRLDDFKEALVLLSQAAELVDPDHRFYPNVHLALASAYQQRFWGFGNPGDRTAAQQAAVRGCVAISRHPIRGLRDLQRYVKHACGFAEIADDPVAVADLLASIERLRHDWAEALSTSPSVDAQVDEAHGLLTLCLASLRGFEEHLLTTAAADLTSAVSGAQSVSELRRRLGKLGQTLELIGLHRPSPQAWMDLVIVAETMVELTSKGSAFERTVAAHNLALARACQVIAEVDAGAGVETHATAVGTIVDLELVAVSNGDVPARQRLQNAEATAALVDRHWPDQSAPLWEAASALLAEVAAWYLPLPAREDILHRFEDLATRAADRLLQNSTVDGPERALVVLRRDSHLLTIEHRRLRQLDAALERNPELGERYKGLIAAILSNETWRARSSWEDQARFDAHQELESLVNDLLEAPPAEITSGQDSGLAEDCKRTMHLFAGPEHAWALIAGVDIVAIALDVASKELEAIAADVPALATKEMAQLRAAAAGPAPEARFWHEGGSELLRTLRRLGTTVVQPVLNALEQSTASRPAPKLHWVLHGRLTGLPLHIAVLGGISKHDVARPEYLLDRCEVTYGMIDAASEIGTDVASVQQAPSLLAVGAPNDGRKRLEQAESELAIAKQAGPWADPVVLTGADADIEHTVEHLRQASVVHFALHGKANPHHPSQSALYLTGAPLTVEHLLGIDLSHVRLGNLSACQTGVVAAAPLRSQSLSLATGFHLAGISKVIATLWSVPDKTTLDFNTEFYQRIWVDGEFRSDRAASAVREAMIAVRDRTGYIAWPSVWAGFVLVRS
ncbi:CHAT domain-containing protein [Glycomyces luteolus]|uniref:CHAT domain-containing protein n=1 Tax=Glycomyces luteolus TaxID=2670330 RepID=A0A9X3P7Q4_9ACTN|nr:CHAT domain-containing protein [Glycomyces luteolus]MDA1359812.1 CHAT domain-containing protein [Glycomyces luteolus]